MKQLTCEMCGSTELVKQDSFFVCQTCGCKYSVEEAKKMMIEGTVEIAGTVKIDESSKVESYYDIAENAYESDNEQEAEKYCTKILEIAPEHYKAWFLKGKAAGWQSSMENDRIEECMNCFNKAFEYAQGDKLEEIKAEAAEEVSSLTASLMKLWCDEFATYPSEANADGIFNYLEEVRDRADWMSKECGASPDEFYEVVAVLMDDAICSAWGDVITEDYQHSNHPSEAVWRTFVARCRSCVDIITAAIELVGGKQSNVARYGNLIEITEKMMYSCSYSIEYIGYCPDLKFTKEWKRKYADKIMEYHQEIKKLDPTYEIPQPSQTGGCYVATCVYGTYDCPQVWTLRRYRDDTLGATWYGRLFIRTYYAISPTLVKWFGNKDWFKKLWKGKLDHMVAKLQNNGVEDTPYEDKEW